MHATPDQADWVRIMLEEHERGLLAYAARLLRDVEAARDVVQDVFLRMIRAERSSVEGHEAEWLFTVCRNRCLDILRKEGRMNAMSERHVEQLSESSSHEKHAAGTFAAHDEQSRAVFEAIDALPHRQQEVIRLKFQGGLSYREISRVTELTVTNVGFLIHTGLKTVRERMARQHAEQRANPGMAR
ncbi:MAG: RNA polymerase sigma factor [Phycisphaerales bacterium]